MARIEGPTEDPSPVRMTDQMDTVRQGDARMMNQYRILGQVGKGQHGEVWLCEDTRDNDKQVVCCISPALCLAMLTPPSPSSNLGDEDREEDKSPSRQDEQAQAQAANTSIWPYSPHRGHRRNRETDSQGDCHHEEVPTPSRRQTHRSHR